MPKFAATTDAAYTFRIRRHLMPKEISNLWELTVKGPNDEEPVVICDADSLSTVLAKMSYVMERDGF